MDVEKLIPRGHLLRRIDGVLDLAFLRELTKPLYSPDQGRPSADPEIFVRMVLLQALYNIDSDRQLCEEVGYNLAYRWFCRLSLQDAVHEHSSISRIRLEATESNLGIKVRKVTADRGYGAGENLEYLQKEKGIRTNIPLWSTRVGRGFLKEDPGFMFQSQTTTVTCPEGHMMRRVFEHARTDMLHFTMPVQTCRGCHRYEACLGQAQKKKRTSEKSSG